MKSLVLVRTWLPACLGCLLLIGCDGATGGSTPDSSAGTGGSVAGSGGASDGGADVIPGSGGETASGGVTGSGGGTASGGVTGSGGGTASGGVTGSGGAGSGGSGSGGAAGAAAPNLYATSAGLVEVFVNGTSVGKTSAAGALLSVAATLNAGAENVIAVRATKGSAAIPYLHTQMNGTFGKAGTSTWWKAKAAATADETTGTAWAAKSYDDSSWSAATDVKVSPTASVMTGGPARGIWTASSSDSTTVFRMRFYIPSNWSASAPSGFGKAVTGGLNGSVVTVTTTAQLAAAVAGNTAKIVQVSGTIDFTGSEGTTSNTCCYVAQCASGSSEYITDDLGACDGKTTFACSYDTAGTTPLVVGSNTTLIGLGNNATIKGKGLKLNQGASNVIIRNLTITGINPQVVWGGDAIDLQGATKVWIDHNRFSLVARQFIVSHYNPNTNITISYNDFDGVTPYSASCNGTHYWVFLFLGTGDTMTALGNWIHHTAGRGPHAGGNATAAVSMHFVNDYYMTVPGHAADPGTGGNLFYEGTYFQNVNTPFMSDSGYSYAPVASNLSSTTSACTSAIGRACGANYTNSTTTTTFPLNQPALTALGAYDASLVQPYPVAEVPYSVPHLAGPGHI